MEIRMSQTAQPTIQEAEEIKSLAKANGFVLAGIAPAVNGINQIGLSRWLAAGRHGDMQYLAKNQSARDNPEKVLAGVRSVIMLALNYPGDGIREKEPAADVGRVAKYARGRDYHDIIRQKLQAITTQLESWWPSEKFRGVVDSAPVMERDFARLAGLGWFGKNTLLIHPQLGSYFFLGGLLTTKVLPYDQPFEADHCGSCQRCLEACPTAALDAPGQMDANKCISYLTIEHRGQIAPALASKMGDHIFGCDICQDVCPWNEHAKKSNRSIVDEFADLPHVSLDLAMILQMDERAFRERFRGTPFFRAKRSRLLRNTIIAVYNGNHQRLKSLVESLCNDADELVRQTAKSILEQWQ